MKTITWLLGLEQGKLIVAMLMVAVASLFLQNQVKESQKDALNLNFRTEILRREDSCAVERLRAIQDANRRVEEFLRALLDKSKKTERTIDSTVHDNKKIIDSATYNVRKVKKLLNNSYHVSSNFTEYYKDIHPINFLLDTTSLDSKHSAAFSY